MLIELDEKQRHLKIIKEALEDEGIHCVTMLYFCVLTNSVFYNLYPLITINPALL